MKLFCSLKSYGDLVIASNFLRRLDPREYGLLAGSHLHPLLQALRFEGSLSFLNTGSSVPAFFDVSKCGYNNALRSIFQLRKRIKASMSDKRDILVFDTLGVRQRYLAWPSRVEQISQGEPNIYLDYYRYLGIPYDQKFMQDIDISKVVIFPDSRIKEKIIPDQLLISICRENSTRGILTRIIKVGLPEPLPALAGCDVKWIDGFDKLIQEVVSAEAIVSADTLPAHLAEYYDIPTFVFTPKPNDYWMPLTAYLYKQYSGFDDLSRYQMWVKRN